MAIVECFKHWRHYLEGSRHTIEVWSDHQNLQGFMKQPRINGRQARWLVYLTPYDFVIKHRPGLLNPADGPSRRPDYKAQGEPSLVQKDLLASRLVESNAGLCNIVKCQLCNAIRLELCDTAKATQRVIARSPLVDSKGQWALYKDKEAVGQRTLIATV
jgi:hypothetical protein